MNELNRQVDQVFSPYATNELNRVRNDNVRFAHYTSAEAGLKILRSGRVLLRNSTLMNDFSEGEYGLNCLTEAYNGPLGARLKDVLRKVQSDLPEVIDTNFNGQILDVLNSTFLTSVSEHLSGHEDLFGRLSMWRAYAQKDGIAFVMNNKPFTSESIALGAFTSPVRYLTLDGFQEAFEKMVATIERNVPFLQTLGGQFIHDQLMHVFRIAIQSTKHPSFQEEREWRVIYNPSLLELMGVTHPDQGKRIPSEIMPLQGVPQRVHAIPFKDYPEEGFVGATLPDLLDRILIGPSQDAYIIQRAFIDELTALNVPNPGEKVIVTGVPLRQ